MLEWFGFWMFLSVLEASCMWADSEKLKLKCKYPKRKFKWWE